MDDYKNLKKIIEAGKSICGPNLQIDHPWLVEMIGEAGFDFVVLDGEHGAVYNNLQTLIIAATAGEINPIVRVPSHDRAFILWALESGARGIQVPMVETVEEAQKIVKEVKYAPLGQRGFSSATRAARFGKISIKQEAKKINSETLLILQLETIKGFQNAEKISQIPGVDIVFIGPYDFAQSMGYKGDPNHSSVKEKLEKMLKTISGYVKTGIAVSPLNEKKVSLWSSSGVQYFLLSSMNPIREVLEKLQKDFRNILN